MMPDQHVHGGHGASGSKRHLQGVLLLSFSSLGIIYGDIGTSPLYALQSVFSTGVPSAAETLSAVSLIFWTLTLIVLVKYVGIIIRFDDNGEGGTFALYSLMCRAAGFTPFGPAQPEELQENVLASTVPAFLRSGKWWSLTNTAVGTRMRQLYANSRTSQVALLFTVMMATAMVVGDGVLTPSISVLSAISGLKVAVPAIQQVEVIGVTIVVLILLFSVQYLGTAKISTVFAPVICIWLLFNAALGFVNLSKYGWGVWQAIGPHHAIGAFTGPGGFQAGWTLLAGVMLSITGAEAMYADLGHFNAQAVTLSFCGLVYPCLIVTYMGQASYITAHPEAYTDPFWNSVPHGAFWPMLIVATAATVVASQALISGVFSIMRQAMNLGVLPPMKVNHTDAGHQGQIYIGQINFYLLIGCIAMVAAFQDTTALGHAYGVAVMSVMFITTILAGIVMLTCYNINPVLVAAFLLLFVPLEGLFLSSNIIKIPEGGWVTIMIAVFVASINLVWWYGSSAKQRWYKTQAVQNKGLLAQVPALADLTDTDDHNPDSSSPIPAASDPLGVSPARKRSNQKLGSFSAGQLDSSRAAAGVGLGGSPFKAAAGQTLGEGQLRAMSCVVGGAHGTSGSGLGSREVTFNDRPLARLPGLGIVYTAATDGLPAVLQHMLINLPVMYDVTVLLTVRVITQPFAADQERFLVRQSKLTGSGMYRVIARYGYMEAIDHGPQFIKQLVACLLKYVAHQDTQQGSDGLTNTTTAALAAAAASGTAAVHTRMPLQEPLWEAGSQTERNGVNGAAAAAAAAAFNSTELGAAPAAAAGAGRLAVAASGGGGVEGRAARGLERWSRVPTAPTDGTMLDEALATAGPKLATSSLTRSLSFSPNTSLDASTAAALRSSLTASSAVLGKESINRHQYGLQKMSYGASRRRAHTTGGAASYQGSAGLSSSGGLSGALSGGLSGGGVEGSHLVTIPALTELTGSGLGVPTEGAARYDTVSRQNGGSGAADAWAGDSTAAGDAAAAADGATSGAAGSLNGHARGSIRLSPAQLQEMELLLTCYRTRAVYIMGRALITPSKGDQASEQRRGLAAAAAHGRKLGVGVMAGAYRFLANNTHPSSQQWLLPDDQLMLVAMVIRV